MNNVLTQRHEHLEGKTISYVVNSGFSKSAQQCIASIQRKIEKEFGEAVWSIPKASLHITLMDWLAPFVDYGEDPDILFRKISSEYTKALIAALHEVRFVHIHFDTICVSPTTIFLQASKSDQLNRIREHVLKSIELLPSTKEPPDITHASIIRFTKETPIAPIAEYVSGLDISLEETLDEFRLVRETKLPMLEYEIIDTFKIEGSGVNTTVLDTSPPFPSI